LASSASRRVEDRAAPQPLERGLGVELLAARGPDDAFGLLDICQR
jgi:hypothetical protein